MKHVTKSAAHTGIFLLLPILILWRNTRRMKAILVLASGLILAGCFQHYYRTNTTTKIDRETLKVLQQSGKYFIIHFKDTVAGLENVSLSDNQLVGTLVEVPPEHRNHLQPGAREGNRVRRADKGMTLIEVHLYYPENKEGSPEASIPLSRINRLDVYETDRQATNSNHILSWIGVGVAVSSVVGLIAFAIACSCPQVYVNNNGIYEFRSGVYSGAVYSTLERPDFLPLSNLSPLDGQYRFRIGNFREEKQYINSVELVRISHPKDVSVLADRHGKIHTYRDPQPPQRAIAGDMSDITSSLRFADNQMYSFDITNRADQLPSVILQFNKPADASSGKLMVHAGNSPWSGYVYREFAALFGNGYEKWRDQQEKATTGDAHQWQVDQGLPMKVYIETANGWKYIDHFALTGNTASRDMVMEIDLDGLNEGPVNIKIESAFFFWNIDKASMDFSKEEKVESWTLAPVSAVTANGTDAGNEISRRDGMYLKLEGDDYVDLAFEAQAEQGETSTSYFLATSGYYHSKPASKGNADLLTLAKFRKAGAFNEFSQKKYREITDNLVHQ